ncbi:related to Abhydrolase domain-containing protein C22H12.03 [Pseudozyma flocculosa]|uniref:Related to Abhydrolase domain-containing protein C22H12.03 n=1 Tax=Pseudozyma flocculosa TaxID=84751 RepID=A0A5C3F1T4_9BASI|nr:related to Abhydrolase domain-containing protein C22H12.03 [Pseudozyma flocculosa]
MPDWLLFLDCPKGYAVGNTVSDPAVKPPPGPTGNTVELDYEAYHPKSSDAAAAAAPRVKPLGPIVVCHGLFGSKQNWRSLGRAMASRFGVDVYALDLRNHGTSPHIDGLDYRDMAADVGRFLAEKGLDNVVLIGHSMGGKVVMSAVLDAEIGKRVSKLISVDMSPRRGPLSKEFEQYMEGMVEIEEAKCETRSAADELLQKIEPDLGVRQFLLTNLTRNPPDSASWSWRIPVRTMQKHISSIGDFPYDAPGSTDEGGSGDARAWDGDVLFVKGAKSKYINRRNVPTNRAHFPNSKMVVMDTGHWCQAEKPNEFVQVVEDFIKGQTVDVTDEALKPRSA